MLISLQALNVLFGTIAAVLLVFAELFKIRSRTLNLRINPARLRIVAYVSTLAFIITLLVIMVNTFLY
jgi:hypothetical protein